MAVLTINGRPQWGRLLKGSIYPKSPDSCPSFGEHVTTMGELLDATIEQVAAILQRGLEQRLVHSSHRPPEG